MPSLAVFSFGIVLLAAGCAAAPPYTEQDLQVRCEVSGGRWHASVTREGHCEYQLPGMI